MKMTGVKLYSVTFLPWQFSVMVHVPELWQAKQKGYISISLVLILSLSTHVSNLIISSGFGCQHFLYRMLNVFVKIPGFCALFIKNKSSPSDKQACVLLVYWLLNHTVAWQSTKNILSSPTHVPLLHFSTDYTVFMLMTCKQRQEMVYCALCTVFCWEYCNNQHII